MTRRTIAVVIAIILLAGAAIAALLLSGRVDPNDVLEAMREYRGAWWMIPAYVAAYALLDVLFIPTQALSIAAPLMWGWKRGGIIELAAATFGSIFPYLIARSTLREWAVRKLHGHAEPGQTPRHPLLHEIGEVLEREGFTFLLLLRLVPIIPYTPLNYLAGLSSVRPVQYVVATLIGTIPSTFIFAYFVQAVAEGVMRPREVLLRVIAAGTLLAILIIATRMAAPRIRRWMHARRTASRPDGADRDSGSPAPPRG
jgi:uncharacterized membrane protein YdjX (TVP38/TMEM64 family)